MKKLLDKENEILNQFELSKILGGDSCACACKYVNQGGSTTECNAYANLHGTPTRPIVRPTTSDGGRGGVR